MRRVLIPVMLCFMLITSLPGYCQAAETAAPASLTVDEAVSRALKNSKALESIILGVDLANEDNEDAKGMWSPKWDFEYEKTTPSIETRYSNLLSAEYKYETSKMKQDMQREVVAAKAQKGYYDLLQAIDKVAVSKSSLTAAEKQFNISQAYYSCGMLSTAAYNQANIQLIQKQADLKAAENDLNNTYVTFNQLVGLKAQDRPALIDTPVLKNIEVKNLDSQIALIANEAPTQLISEEGADLQERLLGFTGSTDKAKIQVDQAELDTAKLKEDTIKGLYATYFTIMSMEESYQTTLRNVTIAEDNLRIAKLKFDIGMGTLSDVAAAETSLAQAKNSLLSLICKHEVLKATFFKPWTA